MDHHVTRSSDPRSISEITNNLLANAQQVLRDEVRLAKTEIREELSNLARASAMLVAGVVLGLFAFGMLLFTVTWALDTFLPLWVSAGIVTLVVAVVAGALVAVGRSRVSNLEPKPKNTVESMKENVQWVKQQTP